MSCWGAQNEYPNEDQEPLLAQYEDETSLQRKAHNKMHSYQMIRALFKGYMPSTEQIILNLRTFLASDFLNLDISETSESGKKLLEYIKMWITAFIKLLKEKNNENQFQDFLYFSIHARILMETSDLVQNLSDTRTKADVIAVRESIRTIGSLLLTNSDFKTFLHDLNLIGRQIFAKTSHEASMIAEDAAREIDPSPEVIERMKYPEDKKSEDTNEDSDIKLQDVGELITNGIKRIGLEAKSSIGESFSGEQKKVLIRRLKAAVTKLRKRNDYSESINIIGILIKRYTQIYSHAVDQSVNKIQKNANTNDSLGLAIENAWSFMSSFGDKEVWTELQNRTNKVMEHSHKDPDFEHFVKELTKITERVFTDPDFYDSEKKYLNIQEVDGQSLDTKSSLREDFNSLFAQIPVTLDSVINDNDVSRLIKITTDIWSLVFRTDDSVNPEIITDIYTIIPYFLQSLQYIPIPRLEISVPEIDLLIENLIIEPGHTVNNSSFLPFSLKIQSFNDLTLHKARFRTVSTITSVVTIKIKGLSLRADEIGFWFRMHKYLFQFSDEGIISIKMDKDGIDIELDVEIGKERLEKILSLKDVRVNIHRFSYSLHKSKLLCLAWLLKPFIRPILRKVIEHKLASSIGDFFHSANRELLFARERLRATRISDPEDLRTFLKAVLTRLGPRDDPDISTNIGVRGAAMDRGSIFTGRYTPGSVVKLWDNEDARARELVDANDEGSQGWKSEIFDIKTKGL